jgi:hypothetical protein
MDGVDVVHAELEAIHKLKTGPSARVDFVK